MEQYYLYIKSLHLIFIVTWFAGLFYIVRLFVYQIEAFEKPSPEKEIIGKQLKIMASRLWNIITWPSMIFKQLQNGVVKYSSNYMRLFNEVPTIILFSIVFLVILKDGVNWIYGTIGIIIFAILLMMGYKIYKRIRENKNNSEF